MKTQHLFPVYTHFHVNKAHLFFRLQRAILSSSFQQIELSGQMFVEAPLPNFTDIRPEGNEQTNRHDKANRRFWSYANAHKN
jgi:hypothetical protein